MTGHTAVIYIYNRLLPLRRSLGSDVRERLFECYLTPLTGYEARAVCSSRSWSVPLGQALARGVSRQAVAAGFPLRYIYMYINIYIRCTRHPPTRGLTGSGSRSRVVSSVSQGRSLRAALAPSRTRMQKRAPPPPGHDPPPPPLPWSHDHQRWASASGSGRGSGS